jgi:hypothetical protein
MTATAAPDAGRAGADRRIARLNTASARRVIDPDVEVTGDFTLDQVIPDDLLSVAGLDLDLTPEQRATLSREEMASIVRTGVEFEAVLMSGFAFALARSGDLTDPRFAYALHEIGEETRHSRLFLRAYSQLRPTQRWFGDNRWLRVAQSVLLGGLFRWPATFDAFVLGGEEIPDLLQKRAAEHPDTDPYITAISRYHRQEEARHLAFARTTVGEHHARATRTDRFMLDHLVPWGIGGMFDTIVQPFVYETIGLPGWATWKQVAASPPRRALRRQCVRAVLSALVDAGVYRPGRIPSAWRRHAEVDRRGRPLPGTE